MSADKEREIRNERVLRLEVALQDFFTELDDIAGERAVSTEWLPFLEGEIGDILEGYREWVNESWEPLSEVAG